MVLAAVLGVAVPAGSAREAAPAVTGGTYVLHRPANLSRSKPVPLVLVCCQGGALNAGVGLSQLADAKGFVVAAIKPTKVYNSPSESGKTGTMLPDIVFLKDVIAEVTASDNIDPARVYVAGASQGAFFALRAACDLSTIVAAAGSIAGGNGFQPCSPSRPVSVIDINGSKDPYVPVSMGQAVADRWRTTNRCAAQPRVTSSGVANDQVWTGCALATGVEFIVVNGAGHAWIRTSQFDSTQELWQFFSQHPLVAQAPASLTATLAQVRVVYAPRRRVVVRLTLGQPSSVRLSLSHRSRTVSTRRAAVAAGSSVLALGVPRSARAGTYRLKVTVAANGVTRKLSRPVRIHR